jgi:acylphosphatase
MIKKHILITGKVQGVGFRNYVLKRATQNQIVGWVRNLSTGQVELLAVGMEGHKFEVFLNYIKRGPERSIVTKFEMKDVETLNFESDTFTVIEDGDTCAF